MMTLLLKLMHILAAIWFFSGIIGRGVTFAQAGKSASVHSAYALLRASDFFERRMVIPGSAAVFLLGLFTALAGGWPLFGFLQGARSNWLLASILLMLLTIPFIPLYLIPRRKQRDRAAAEALARGEVTPEFSAALADRGVIGYRFAELAIVVTITFLMVIKPF